MWLCCERRGRAMQGEGGVMRGRESKGRTRPVLPAVGPRRDLDDCVLGVEDALLVCRRGEGPRVSQRRKREPGREGGNAPPTISIVSEPLLPTMMSAPLSARRRWTVAPLLPTMRALRGTRRGGGKRETVSAGTRAGGTGRAAGEEAREGGGESENQGVVRTPGGALQWVVMCVVLSLWAPPLVRGRGRRGGRVMSRREPERGGGLTRRTAGGRR